MTIATPDPSSILMEVLSMSGTDFYNYMKLPIIPPSVTQELAIYNSFGPGGAGGFNNTYAAVFFAKRGGPTSVSIDVQASYQFKVFGGTNCGKEANDVYRALCDILHMREMVMVSTGCMMNCAKEMEGQDVVDPVEGWPYVLVYFAGMFRVL